MKYKHWMLIGSCLGLSFILGSTIIGHVSANVIARQNKTAIAQINNNQILWSSDNRFNANLNPSTLSTINSKTTVLDNSQPIVVPSSLGLASDAYEANIYLTSYIFNFIKSNVVSLANNISPHKLNIDDITYKIDKESIDNTKGSLSINITILNHKAWVDGVIQDQYDFNHQSYMVIGFQTQSPTTQSLTSLKVVAPYTDMIAYEMDKPYIIAYLKSQKSLIIFLEHAV